VVKSEKGNLRMLPRKLLYVCVDILNVFKLTAHVEIVMP